MELSGLSFTFTDKFSKIRGFTQWCFTEILNQLETQATTQIWFFAKTVKTIYFDKYV